MIAGRQASTPAHPLNSQSLRNPIQTTSDMQPIIRQNQSSRLIALRRFLGALNRCDRLRDVFPARLFCLLWMAVLLGVGSARAQDIYTSVAPNSNGSDTYVEIANPSGTFMHFYTDPTPSAARMRRADMQVDWPNPLFGPDPGQSYNRLSSNQSLRVYPKTLPANTEILIEFSYGPGGQHYYIHVLVTDGARVDEVTYLDPNPSTAATVRWRMKFDQPISNVTAANFALESNITGVAITSVTPDTAQPSANWTVTASTGTTAGTLALRWVGHQTEVPPVPNPYLTPGYYSFTDSIFYTQNLPTEVVVLPNTTRTLSAIATRRNGQEMFFRWYVIPPGSSTPAVIPGTSKTWTPPITSSSYTPPVNATEGYRYFCSVYGSPGQEFTPGLFLHSNTVTFSVLTLNAAAQAGFTNTNATAAYSLTTAAGPSVAGGTFSGNGVNGDTFNPAAAGFGVHTVTYSVGGVQVSFTITVNEAPSLNVTTTTDVVNNRDGLTSLREALTYAQALGGAQTVTFAPALAGQTITVTNGWTDANDDSALRISGNVTVDGGTGVTINLSAPVARRLFLNGGTLTLRNLTLSGADIRGRQSGGALWSTGTGTITNVRFINNRADHGGAIYNLGTMTVSGSSFENNATAASGHGGAIWSNNSLGISGTSFSQNTAGQLGGAIASFNGLTVTDSIFSTNSSGFNGGALRLEGSASISGSTLSNNSAANGGGGLISHGTTTLTNVTIANNTALDAGGAQFFEGTASLRYVTIARNTATNTGGGMFVNSASVTAINTIVSGNAAATNVNLGGNALNAASSNNVLNLSAAAAGIGVLANNGGPMQTIALLAGSPAINAGVAVSGVTGDQRGTPRGARPDAGAFEFTDFAPQLQVTTAADENDGTSDPAYGTGTSLREALADAQGAFSQTGFGVNGSGWTLNGATPNKAANAVGSLNDILTLTPATGGTNSAWLNRKVNVNSFTASFRYTQNAGGGGADGFAFTLQNAGLSALGSGGGGLGYGGIGQSVAFAFNIYGGLTRGFAVYQNGNVTGSYTAPGNGVSLINGQPVDITIAGSGTTATLTMTQGANVFTTTFNNLNIASLVGSSTAYIGFTGATGGSVALQQVSRFNVTAAPLAATLSFAPALAGQTINLSTAAGSADGWETSSALSVTGNVTIDGLTASPGVTLGIGAAAALRHFVVRSGGSLTLGNLALTGGKPQLASFNRGGAISAFGDLTARNCTFTGNTSPGEGGAIQNWPGAASLLLENCTFTGNTGGTHGSAFSTNSPQATLRHLTITGNTASGSAVVLWGTQGTMVNSIVAGNVNDTILTGNSGTFTAQSTHNLLGASAAPGLTGGSNGNQLGVSAAALLLGSLTNNGGPTPTVAIGAGSLAVDACVAIAGLTTDQRGGARPQGGAVDIGAFELAPSVAAAIPLVSPLGGIYLDGVQVSITSPSARTAVRYTLDGSTPSATNGFPYTAPFTLTQTATVRAIAYDGGWLPSPVASVGYTMPTPFADWRALHGLAANGSQDLASPAGDGVPNLLKYAFNLAPTAGSLTAPNSTVLPEGGTAGLPFITRDEQGRLFIEFLRRKAANGPGIAYLVETGDDLANLLPLDLSGASVMSLDAQWERVTVIDPVITSQRFGRVRVRGPYANDFTTGPGAATLRGSAVWSGQAVMLTDAINGQGGVAVLDGFTSTALGGFSARFSLALGPTTSSGTPGDGVSFAVGDLGTGTWGELGPGTAQSLAVGFDTYNNGGNGDIGIHVWIGATHIASQATNPYTGGASVPVQISYDPATGLTVRYNNTLIFTQLALPGFSLPAGGRFGFGARTGGANERAIVDDIVIAPR